MQLGASISGINWHSTTKADFCTNSAHNCLRGMKIKADRPNSRSKIIAIAKLEYISKP